MLVKGGTCLWYNGLQILATLKHYISDTILFNCYQFTPTHPFTISKALCSHNHVISTVITLSQLHTISICSSRFSDIWILRPSDPIWRQEVSSTLIQVVTCFLKFLTEPMFTHRLIRSGGVLRREISQESLQISITMMYLQIAQFKVIGTSP